MADPMNDDLVGRLEKAEAGDRKLDTLLANHFDTADTPPVTTSLDAALALAERVLPGSDIGVMVEQRLTDRTIWQGFVTNYVEDACFAPTPALALCVAILKARPSAGTGSHEGEEESA